MKKQIFILTLLLTTSLLAQQKVIEKSFETSHWSIQSMEWDESQQKYIYNVIEDINSDYSNIWNVTLYDDGTGEVRMDDPGDESSLFVVHEWKLDKIGERDGIVGEFTDETDGSSGTLFIATSELGVVIEFFMPKDRVHFVFDNIKS